MRQLLLAVALLAGCGGPTMRIAKPSEVLPSGLAPHAQHRLVTTHEDGSKEWVLVLSQGDEVATALLDFAKSENVVAARQTAIGAVRDPEVGWFDLPAKRYHVLSYEAQVEIVSLVGDIGVTEAGKPLVHSHVVLSDHHGHTFGGHLIKATTSPTLEVFITTFPTPLVKKPDPASDLVLFDLQSSPRLPGAQ